MTGVERVEVGRVVKPHGLRGEVVVHLTSDVPDRLAVGTQVWIDGKPSTVAAARDHQGRPLIRFAHVADRTAAERLRGAKVEAGTIVTEELDTYLAGELVGVRVLDGAGKVLGTVTGLIEMPPVAGYDLLEVTAPDGRTWLLPAADELVEAVEDDEGLHLVAAALPDGLLDVAAPPASGSTTGSTDGEEGAS
jgi:16S rRNA processing protein RimM